MPSRPSIPRDRARRLRRDATDAERKLWSRLRARQLEGVKFRRQFPIGDYIVDFCCPDHGLVVELDGGQHSFQIEADENRTAALAQRGYRVLRFWNNDVLADIDAVLERVPLSPKGEGNVMYRGKRKARGICHLCLN